MGKMRAGDRSRQGPLINPQAPATIASRQGLSQRTVYTQASRERAGNGVATFTHAMRSTRPTRDCLDAAVALTYPSPMDITIETIDGVTVIRLNGTLGVRSVNGFRDQISALIAGGATRFVVDAAQLRFVDSMGLGALLYLRRFARQGKGDVRIASAGRELLGLLDLSGLRTVFEVSPDVPTALARFAEAVPPAS
jgi:anti-sigma B factor antagonist